MNKRNIIYFFNSLDLENNANFSFRTRGVAKNYIKETTENKNEVSPNTPEKLRRRKYLVKNSLLSEKIESKIVRKILTFQSKCNSEKKSVNPTNEIFSILSKPTQENKVTYSLKKHKKSSKKKPLEEFLRKAFNSDKKLKNECIMTQTKDKETSVDLINKTETEKTREELQLTTLDHSAFIEMDKENKGDLSNYEPSFLEKVYLEKHAIRKTTNPKINQNYENKENFIPKNQNFIEVVTLNELKKKESERTKKLGRKGTRKTQNK